MLHNRAAFPPFSTIPHKDKIQSISIHYLATVLHLFECNFISKTGQWHHKIDVAYLIRIAHGPEAETFQVRDEHLIFLCIPGMTTVSCAWKSIL